MPGRKDNRKRNTSFKMWKFSYKGLKIVLAVCVLCALGLFVYIIAVVNRSNTAVEQAATAAPAVQATDAAVTASPTPAPDPVEPTSTYTSAQWPSTDYPDVPAFASSEYAVLSENGRSEITLSAGSDSQFADYAQTLAAGGFSIYMDNDLITVLVKEDLEIQLIPDADAPTVILCKEPAATLADGEGEGYTLPEAGRLVSAEQSADEASLILTYRCASYTDVMDYLDLLRREGWVSTESVIDENGACYAQYQNGDRIIVVDYFTNTNGYLITLSRQNS